jgi:uncharacterized RDD family membrane protein YckC
MKCPKCHYLSFQPEPRCKHCGYDFSLADSDLTLLPTEDPEPPLADLELRPERPVRSAIGLMRPVRTPEMPEHAWAGAVALEEFEPEVRPSERVFPPRERPKPAPNTTSELPLFIKVVPDAEPDELVLQVPAAPRPLMVRRGAPEAGRAKQPDVAPAAPKRLGLFDRDLLEDLERIEAEEAARTGIPAPGRAAGSARRIGRPMPVIRLAAACMDALLLGALNVAVFWLTLRQTDLTLSQAGILPIVPFVLFLLVLDVGYLWMFTAAGGQTIGKMAVGLRVVHESPIELDDRVTIKQAVYRSLLTLPSVLMLGAGFIPALFGRGRAIHDRITHTRVIRA